MNKRSIFKRMSALLLTVALLASTVLAAEHPKEPLVDLPQEPPAEQDPNWSLLLVNPEQYLPENFSVELVKLKNGMEVDARIYDDLNAMLIACWAAGLEPKVCSAYRSLSTQTRLYNNKVSRLRAQGYSRNSAKIEAARWVAPPDSSEHQTGMALDLVSTDYPDLNAKQANTPEQKWLMKHCWEYGFILRYPAEKSKITGIGYEPWHYRYVGKEIAVTLQKTGDCFEEYLQTIAPVA